METSATAKLDVLPADPALHEAIDRLSTVIERLMGPDGCPWDREQTPESLTEYLIEECFELVEAIRSGTPADMGEEMGDVAFLLLFLSRVSADRKGPTLTDALHTATEKMVRRHPHVFGEARFANQAELLKNWDRIKREEKTRQEPDGEKKPGTYDSLPKGLPPLTKAYRIHSKAARIGFTWPEDSDVEQQVEAEWLELLDACAGGGLMGGGAPVEPEHVERELGDHLFTLVELGRRKGIKAAAALEKANARFLDRVARMEELARQRGLDFPNLSLDEKDELWNEVKEQEAAD